MYISVGKKTIMPRYVNVASVLFLREVCRVALAANRQKKQDSTTESGNSAGFVGSRRKPCGSPDLIYFIATNPKVLYFIVDLLFAWGCYALLLSCYKYLKPYRTNFRTLYCIFFVEDALHYSLKYFTIRKNIISVDSI